MVEHAAVNRGVVGSSPTRGATVNFKCTRDCHLKFTFFNFKNKFRRHTPVNCIWPHGQAVKTSPFHGGNTSSNLVGVTVAV